MNVLAIKVTPEQNLRQEEQWYTLIILWVASGVFYVVSNPLWANTYRALTHHFTRNTRTLV